MQTQPQCTHPADLHVCLLLWPCALLQVSADGPRDYRMVVQRLYEREPQLAMGRFRRR